jgi:hypothetical protein
MGGDCSQKLLLRRGWHSSPGRSRSSDQYEIHNSIAKIGSLRPRFPGGLFFLGLQRVRLSAFPGVFFPNQFFPYCPSQPASSL